MPVILVIFSSITFTILPIAVTERTMRMPTDGKTNAMQGLHHKSELFSNWRISTETVGFCFQLNSICMLGLIKEKKVDL